MNWWEVSYGETGIYLSADEIYHGGHTTWSPSIQNTVISNCSSIGIYCLASAHDYSSESTLQPEILNCNIQNCINGIECYAYTTFTNYLTTATINLHCQNNLIENCQKGMHFIVGDNYSYFYLSSISNTIIQCDDGIYFGNWFDNVNINNNIILQCENGILFQSGGYVLSVSNNTISYCSSYGIKCESNVDGSFKNNILYQNDIGIYRNFSFPTDVLYNCFDNDSLNFVGFPSTYGTNWTTNANGDSCDLSYNIMLDPLIVDSLDFNLTSQSPCIDAGDPTSPFDPDCTIADMGAFYYFQGFCPPIADFTSDITYGFAPLTVNFTDLSTHLGGAAIISWDWDFGDTFTDNLQNPTHIYQDPGTYTVTLTVIDEHDSTDTEIKIDYITVYTDEPPAAPENVNIEIIGNDAVITWDSVDSTIYGNPIIVDYYLIFYSEIPYQDSLFFFHGFTADTTYTHYSVTQFADNMFYHIVAYVGNIERLNELVANKEKVTLRELVSILEEDNINRNCKRK